ncbi:kinesin-like protein KIF6, partial [Myotis lucifugus]|uniref:kinesin-like protein KIF6 n=1 Tax=Myotis lucifugus TaxID=59463 RepID=UPI000CCC16AF
MVKQTIQIFARVKPTVRKQPQGIYSIDEDEKVTPSLEIILPRDLADGFVNNKRESYRFKFQRIFDQDTNQETIFESIAKPVAESPLLSSPRRFMPLNRWMFSGLFLSGLWAAFCSVTSFFLASTNRHRREVCLSCSVSGAEVWK